MATQQSIMDSLRVEGDNVPPWVAKTGMMAGTLAGPSGPLTTSPNEERVVSPLPVVEPRGLSSRILNPNKLVSQRRRSLPFLGSGQLGGERQAPGL